MMNKKLKSNKNRWAKKAVSYMLAGTMLFGVMCPVLHESKRTFAQDNALMTDSEGAMFLDGEEIQVTFDGVTQRLLPISLGVESYLRVTRTDDQEAALKVSIKGVSTTASTINDVYELKKDEDTGVVMLGAGDYYIVLDGVEGSTCSVKAEITTGMPLTLSDKMKLDAEAGEAYFYQFTAKQTGYLNVENLTKKSKLSVKLLNEEKSELSKSNKLSTYSKKKHKDGKTMAGFGIVEGKTYILEIKSDKDCAATFEASMKSTKGKKYYKTVGGEGYTSAKSMKKNKTYYCTMGAGEDAQYFTFKKKSYASNLFLKTSTLKNQGSVKMLLYYKEVKGTKKGQILPVKVNGKQIGYSVKGEYKKTLKIPANWPNLTYYVVYKRGNSKSSGSFQLKLS